MFREAIWNLCQCSTSENRQEARSIWPLKNPTHYYMLPPTQIKS